MLHGDDAVQSLREALHLSPDNVQLRIHLAETLVGLGRADEAEREYREALALAPDDLRLKLGLAGAFYQQGKNSHSLVIVEDLLKLRDTPARAYLLHARLLLRAGEVERAVAQYKNAVAADGSVADAELAGGGATAQQQARQQDDSEGGGVGHGGIRQAVLRGAAPDFWSQPSRHVKTGEFYYETPRRRR